MHLHLIGLLLRPLQYFYLACHFAVTMDQELSLAPLASFHYLSRKHFYFCYSVSPASAFELKQRTIDFKLRLDFERHLLEHRPNLLLER